MTAADIRTIAVIAVIFGSAFIGRDSVPGEAQATTKPCQVYLQAVEIEDMNPAAAENLTTKGWRFLKGHKLVADFNADGEEDIALIGERSGKMTGVVVWSKTRYVDLTEIYKKDAGKYQTYAVKYCDSRFGPGQSTKYFSKDFCALEFNLIDAGGSKAIRIKPDGGNWVGKYRCLSQAHGARIWSNFGDME